MIQLYSLMAKRVTDKDYCSERSNKRDLTRRFVSHRVFSIEKFAMFLFSLVKTTGMLSLRDIRISCTERLVGQYNAQLVVFNLKAIL